MAAPKGDLSGRAQGIEKVGIFGGTFDPIHLGHVEVARQVRRSALELDRVLLVPSWQPPHRPPPVAPAADRLDMVAAAVAREAGLVASDVEVKRKGVSYTVDTVRQLAEAHPDAQLFLLIGWDAARDLGTWHDFAEIPRWARIVVFNRMTPSGHLDDAPGDVFPPAVGPGSRGALPAGLRDHLDQVSVDSPPISATAVRADLAAGGDGLGFLPPSVLRLIRERGLYSTAPGFPGAPVS